jgi:sensor c-di-GMP phosphodiesterase-like protein
MTTQTAVRASREQQIDPIGRAFSQRFRPSGSVGAILNKALIVAVAIMVGVVAVGSPILISLYLAREQSFNEEMAQVTHLAYEIRRHSDTSSDQAYAAFRTLEGAHASDPCSDANVQLMKQLKLQSDNLEAVGYIAGDRLLCSSLDQHGTAIPVGAADYLSRTGVYIRVSVPLPMAPDRKFFISTRRASGYTVIVHRDLLTEVSIDRPYTALGAVGYTTRRLNMSVGPFDVKWLDALGNKMDVQLFDGKNLVSVQRSARYDFAAYAAVPATNVVTGLRHFALVLVPIGVIAGMALALTVFLVARTQLGLPAVLKLALRRKEYFLAYQPIVDLRTREWVGAEALIRWRRSSGETVRPDLFIGVAEETGLIQRITQRVVELVIADTKGLFVRHPAFHISINLSPQDLHSKRTVELFGELIRTSGAGRENLLVEATERGFIKTEDAQEVIRDLRALGVQVAIDDFGTGYSSLAYLETLDLDYLKIDKAFVDTVGTNAPTGSVVMHIIEMAKDLELNLVAEGVETEAQAQVLLELGVRYAQGFLFARPMPFSDLIARYAKQVA